MKRVHVGNAAYNITFTYDDNGNRILKNADGSVTTYTIDAADQVTSQVDSDGTTTYTYDNAGNLTEKDAPAGTTFYTHDAANQLIEAEPPSGAVGMTYNAMFQRVVKSVTGGDMTKFIYDGMRLLAETDDSHVTTRSFTSSTAGAGGEFGGLVSEYDAGDMEESYPAYDAQWATRELLDDSGNTEASYRNTAFGLLTDASSGSWCDLSPGQWSNMSVDHNVGSNVPVRETGKGFQPNYVSLL